MARPSRTSQKHSRLKIKEKRVGFLLKVIDGQNLGTEHFFEEEASIGRVEGNSILLVEPGVSRNHLKIISDHGVYLLEDLKSANGTLLNSDKISEQEVLKDGDYITLGQTTYLFSVLDPIRGDATSKTSFADLEQFAEEEERSKPKFVLTKRKKILIAISTAALIIGLITFFILKNMGKGPIFDQSNNEIEYVESEDFFNAVFGYGEYDKTHKNQVIISFEYLTGRVTLRYGAWGIDKVGEVKIFLNDHDIGNVKLTLGRWVYGLKLVLPKKWLKRGKNALVFRNMRNPKADDDWEICYVQIQQEAIPPPNKKEAIFKFELAKKAWENRRIEPRATAIALNNFKRARDLLEGLDQKPNLYNEANDYIEKAEKELTARFQEGLFSFRRIWKLERDKTKARTLLLRTIRYFPKDDFRYRELKRRLDELDL